MGLTPFRFSNLNVEKYFNELQGKMFIQERGFDASMIVCKEILPIVWYHRWECFWTFLKETVVIPILQNFMYHYETTSLGIVIVICGNDSSKGNKH